jgi:hypothetical protein
VQTVLVRKWEGTRPTGYEDNIQTGVEEIKVEGVDWIKVAEDKDSGTLL